ncbi:YhdH/YhfP family quinone oxidoreductase [Gilvimarinus xylanilyticus]|uniref:YhdH/YhfP family quinone oxidoreductase n=1 Tax=Gilvimarinus xylanilyticus TaxID=2944139 RepID=A0A9X2HU41_9GAMM|nr:YhdH/YhfP family quinone oxidoreductase [Gilvimarinus xylanilyticus]MCP8898518.1 YhdH/YhfP family quinone oxidoreductase [Gilvimarinus xylanilyticus]
MTHYQALRVTQQSPDDFHCEVARLPLGELGSEGVLIKVYYSCLNYKDALSAAGNPGVTRTFPHTPGIDAAGVVEQDPSGVFAPGQRVLISGYDFGMNTPGGLAEYCRVPAQWVSVCPDDLSLRNAMLYGTAGLTAAMAMQKIQKLQPEVAGRRFVVTGASGAVGSLAVLLAAHAGYSVTAVTGKAQEFDRLTQLGASQCLPAEDLLKSSPKPLLKPEWDCGLDSLGGAALVNVLKATAPEGAIANCGLALGPELEGNVFPFILRGVSLLGIDSVEQPLETKRALWQSLAAVPLTAEQEALIIREVELTQVPELLAAMLKGSGRGRVVVNLQAKG